MKRKKRYLLDTNAVSALTQEHAGDYQKIAAKVASLEEAELYISILSIYEMEYGAFHANDPEIAHQARLAIQLIKDEDEMTVLPLTEAGAEIFGEIKEQYRKEKGIGKKALQKHNVDLILAATAIEVRATYVSHDNKDRIFEILQNIRDDFDWEDWTK
ncbi:PilT-like protein [Beggiatoa sp. PS]|nr:PilT-like protein [Beggiatoa sp. PS]